MSLIELAVWVESEVIVFEFRIVIERIAVEKDQLFTAITAYSCRFLVVDIIQGPSLDIVPEDQG